jgi:hypothetical protein
MWSMDLVLDVLDCTPSHAEDVRERLLGEKEFLAKRLPAARTDDGGFHRTILVSVDV